MSWSKALKNIGGSLSKVKKAADGTTHFLCSAGGSMKNHAHIIVSKSGKAAHCVPHKNNRK
jgi:hypothetical protein